MSADQIIFFSVIAVALILFIWNRWRYDIVALSALLFLCIVGIIPADRAFSGFGHPAVITVAAVLLISRGLMNAGVVDVLSRQLGRVSRRPTAQVATLTGIVALCSGFMNNTGALALFMPVGIWMARQDGRSPSFLLMPLAFGSLIGGSLTLIGTPPNLILSGYRQEALGAPYSMFDFLPVGAAVTVVGVVFIALIGWRMIPKRQERSGGRDLFEVSSYLTELRVPEGSTLAGRSLRDLYDGVGDKADFLVTALFREGGFRRMPGARTMLFPLDILQVEADADNIKALVDASGLELAPEAESKERSSFDESELKLVEAIVPADSALVGRSANRLELRDNNNLNVLAVARRGERMRERLDKVRFMPGDILLVQMHEESVQSDLSDLGLLPLASRGLRVGTPRRVLLAAAMFAAAITLIAAGVLPAQVGMSLCALAMLLTGMLKPGEIYESIEMPVIVLLGCMLPIGAAMESTGGSELIARLLLEASGAMPHALLLALLMGTVMLLSNVLNHAASTVLAAPVALSLAKGMAVSPDPFLMAVCIGASCTFLTPLAHQSNTLVMEPGGYRFGDYWRMGLPLSLLCMACAVPMILAVWPLRPL